MQTLITLNKKAQHDYFLEERFEAGLVLQGWEVKSIRAGHVQIRDSYVLLKGGEAWLVGSHISPLETVSTHITPDPTRSRKLLLNKKELEKLYGKVERRGYTVVPVSLYFKKGRVKCEIALAKGKKTYDKRETIKKRDFKRQKERIMKR